MKIQKKDPKKTNSVINYLPTMSTPNTMANRRPIEDHPTKKTKTGGWLTPHIVEKTYTLSRKELIQYVKDRLNWIDDYQYLYFMAPFKDQNGTIHTNGFETQPAMTFKHVLNMSNITFQVCIEPTRNQGTPKQNFRSGVQNICRTCYGKPDTIEELRHSDNFFRKNDVKYTQRPSDRGYDQFFSARAIEVTDDKRVVLKDKEGQVIATYNLREPAKPQVFTNFPFYQHLPVLDDADVTWEDPDTINLDFIWKRKAVHLSIDNRGATVPGYDSTRKADFSLHVQLTCRKGLQKHQSDMHWKVPHDDRQPLWDFLNLGDGCIWDMVSETLYCMYEGLDSSHK